MAWKRVFKGLQMSSSWFCKLLLHSMIYGAINSMMWSKLPITYLFNCSPFLCIYYYKCNFKSVIITQCVTSSWTGTVQHVVSVCCVSGCDRCPLPAGTPSCQGQRCCPSSAWWGPAGGGHDTSSPTAMGYSWAPLSWQPFSTATGPLLHPVWGREERGVRAAVMWSKSRGEERR